MTINEQKAINVKAVETYNAAMNALEKTHGGYTAKRLRSCTAMVLSVPGYRLLRSYFTIVAVIDNSEGICYDVLRFVYGYTATSAQHISKFAHDYADGNKKLTWRYIK